jgi:hypothetical protein
MMIMLSVDLDGYACGRSLAWHQPSLGDSSVRPWSRGLVDVAGLNSGVQ